MGPYYTQETHQTTSKDATYELMTKLVKFIMCFSILTFFLSNPSWVSLFLHSFISHVSSFPSHFFTHINNKNYIFLLCNGILVILAKSSRKMINGNSVTSTAANEVPPTTAEQDEEREILELQTLRAIERELEVKENEFLMEEDSENGQKNRNYECCVEVEKDLAEEVSIARLSTEKLNRKFDEFIRKMKEEIGIEAQQQLIMEEKIRIEAQQQLIMV